MTGPLAERSESAAVGRSTADEVLREPSKRIRGVVYRRVGVVTVVVGESCEQCTASQWSCVHVVVRFKAEPALTT